MIHKEFIKKLSENLHISKKKASHYSQLIIETIRKTAEKEEVDIENFGKFYYNEAHKMKLDPDKNLLKEINLK